MEDKLRAYMDHLFQKVKPSRKSVELKEEILQNLTDKYHDLLIEGKTQEAAYNIAIASIGDTEELMEGLKDEGTYLGVTQEEIERGRRKSAMLTAIAVMMYILSILPPLLLSGTPLISSVGPAAMFTMIAIATGLIVYGHMSRPRYKRMDDSIVEEFKEWQNQTDADLRACKSIISAMWAIITVIYFVVSFMTMAWYITWVIFLIGTAIQEIIKAVFELKRRGGNE